MKGVGRVQDSWRDYVEGHGNCRRGKEELGD